MTALNKKIASAVAGISVTAAVAGCAATDEGPTSASTSAAPTSGASAAGYADGEYSADGQYGNLPSRIGVTVTLKDDVITDVRVTPHATDPTSRGLQERFADAVGAVVVGKDIDDVRLDRVAGNSGTPKGFNAAIERIKREAAEAADRGASSSSG